MPKHINTGIVRRVLNGVFLWLLLPLAAAARSGPSCPTTPIRLEYLDAGMFYSAGKDGNGKGIDVDLIAEIERRSGCAIAGRIELRVRTWGSMQAGRIEMMVYALRTPERDRFAWFIPYARLRHVLLLGPGAPSAVHRLADFQARPELKFGVVHGYRHNAFYDGLIEQWRKAGRVIDYPDGAALNEALRQRKVAAIVCYPTDYRHYMDDGQVQRELRVTDWNPDKQFTIAHLVLSKQHFAEQEAAKWSKLVGAMRVDGTLRRIFEKYLGAAEANAMLP